MLLTFSVYALFLENRRGVNALIRSWHCVKGSWGDVFGKYFFLGLICIVIFIAITLLSLPFSHVYPNPLTHKPQVALPISSTILIQILTTFLFGPLSVIYSLSIFKLLSAKPFPAPEEEKSTKKKILILSIIGIVAAVAIIIMLSLFAAHSLQTSATINFYR